MDTQQSPALPVAACPLWETETQWIFHLLPLMIKKTEENLENTATCSPWLNTPPMQQGCICECEILAIVHLSWNSWAFLWNLGKAEGHLTYFRLMFLHVSPSSEPLCAGCWHFCPQGAMVSIWDWGYCPISLPQQLSAMPRPKGDAILGGIMTQPGWENIYLRKQATFKCCILISAINVCVNHW